MRQPVRPISSNANERRRFQRQDFDQSWVGARFAVTESVFILGLGELPDRGRVAMVESLLNKPAAALWLAGEGHTLLMQIMIGGAVGSVDAELDQQSGRIRRRTRLGCAPSSGLRRARRPAQQAASHSRTKPTVNQGARYDMRSRYICQDIANVAQIGNPEKGFFIARRVA
jgi:hypothetical protein